ncbi:hypothetical protein RJ55_08382 [Drechmeria coniospora]|nr:hypothetical protein RJ55_08382 [Drechmeria coniospora]
MPSIGPQPPAPLNKRKRTPEAGGDGDVDISSKHARREPNADEIDLGDSADEDDDIGPSAAPALPPTMPPTTTTPPSQPSTSAAGPLLPPSAVPREAETEAGTDAGSSMLSGPQQGSTERQDTSSDSDSDDYGPSLPSATTKRAAPIGPSPAPSEAAPQRDSWMLAPPSAASGYAERDPTRMRNRKFASKPAAPGASAVSSIWTETAEEKLRRLQDSVLGRTGGVGGESDAPDTGGHQQRSKADEERDRRIAASVEASRGESMYDAHAKRQRSQGVAKDEEEDDPSKRAFDREKDMALGGKIGTAQRRELVAKSANFGGRFQKGSYL